mgnify:CR=1 FL=1
MKTTARVVVIGGGITGCSILYHLAKMGWTDSILIERQELTSGSSWHAAGGLFTVLGPNPAAQMHKYTFDMYQELEKQGYNCGFHFSGGLNLFRTEEEKESFTVVQSAVRRLGIESEFISLKEAKEKAPIINTDHLIGAMWEVEGGHVDPASATNAFAQAARDLGATVERFNPVIETNQLPNGHWQVVTEKGTIECEKLVNAAGLWGREVAALAGITLPLVPVEHHYLVTDVLVLAPGPHDKRVIDRNAGNGVDAFGFDGIGMLHEAGQVLGRTGRRESAGNAENGNFFAFEDVVRGNARRAFGAHGGQINGWNGVACGNRHVVSPSG